MTHFAQSKPTYVNAAENPAGQEPQFSTPFPCNVSNGTELADGGQTSHNRDHSLPRGAIDKTSRGHANETYDSLKDDSGTTHQS